MARRDAPLLSRLLAFLPSLSFGVMLGLLAGLALAGALQPPEGTKNVRFRYVAPVLPPCTQIVKRNPPQYRCWDQVYNLQAVGPPTPMPGVPAR